MLDHTIKRERERTPCNLMEVLINNGTHICADWCVHFFTIGYILECFYFTNC